LRPTPPSRGRSGRAWANVVALRVVSSFLRRWRGLQGSDVVFVAGESSRGRCRRLEIGAAVLGVTSLLSRSVPPFRGRSSRAWGNVITLEGGVVVLEAAAWPLKQRRGL
jgi:hypothetical protein